MTQFTGQTYFGQYLPEGATEVDAVVSVSAIRGENEAPSTGAVERVELLVGDRSGSMGGDKIRALRQGLNAAVSVLADGTWFAVIVGNDTAQNLYPGDRVGLAQASDETRAAARSAIQGIGEGGGTNIPAWLDKAGELARQRPGAIAHMLLLTDGKIEPPEAAARLPRSIKNLEGVLTADCRGVGADWVVSELRRIGEGLLGTVDIIKDPAGMVEDFRQVIQQAMAKVVSPELLIWAPKGAEVVFVKQVAPTILPLTFDAAKAPNPLTGVYATGAWADGDKRDYHVRVKLAAAGGVGDQKAAARIKLVVDGQVLVEQLVSVQWTDDLALATMRVHQVDHYTGKAELAQAIQDGLAAKAAGDLDTATAKLGRAAQLAQDDPEMTARLKKVADFSDEEAAGGTVRLKKNVAAADEMELDTGSTRTVRIKK